MIVKYGNLVIDVDLDKTKEYYTNYTLTEENQIYRNYKKYCENMPNEEKSFFESFCINPLCCKLFTSGIAENNTLPVYTYYYVAGRYVNFPDGKILTADYLAEDEHKSLRMSIGVFQFDFKIHDNPDDIPEGFICIDAHIEALPWLLNEKCETEPYRPPKYWQIFKRPEELKQSKISTSELINQVKSDLEKDLSNNGITYSQLNKAETKKLFATWVSRFVPLINKREIRKFLISENRKHRNYLWHAFSYGKLPTETNKNAPVCYSDMEKGCCYIILNSEHAAYQIDGAEKLPVNTINKYNDILIFDCYFTWTYCHTHEKFCGPFFYNKNNPPEI